MSPQLLSVDDVLALVRLSRATLYRFVRAGSFPAPVKLGRSARWRASDVDAWIAALEPAPKSAA